MWDLQVNMFGIAIAVSQVVFVLTVNQIKISKHWERAQTKWKSSDCEDLFKHPMIIQQIPQVTL